MSESRTSRPADGPIDQPALREVRFEYSRAFPQILEHINASLLVSTYQAGKLAVVGVHEGSLTFSFHNFQQAMGVAAADRLAVGTRHQIFFLEPNHELAGRVEPLGMHDACWLTRSSHVTGNIHGHELAWGNDGLWVVNTLFSCLCTLDSGFSFVPRWRPPFITELAAEDRCHLNGLVLEDGRPRYVTAHSESNEAAGWRPVKATSGCVIDVESGETLARGFSMPHSPRIAQQRLWVLDSGKGQFLCVDRQTGHTEPIVELPGYARGLAFCGQFAFVGLSKIRETSVFGGVPIAERRNELRCGVAAVDLVSGQTVATLQFHSGVDEIFAVEVLPQCRWPVLSGPSAEDDGEKDIWLVPPEHAVPGHPARSRPGEAALHSRSSASGRSSAQRTAKTPVATDARSLIQQAGELHRQARLTEAAACYRRALAVDPNQPEVINDLGNVLQEMGDQDGAIEAYRTALASRPELVAAHKNLGYLLLNHGETHEALKHYEQAQRIQPEAINQLLAATALPVVYDSVEDVKHWRERVQQEVGRLADEGVRIDTTRSMVPTSFLLAYQGENDRDIARNLGRVYQGAELCPAGRSGQTQDTAIGGSRRSPRQSGDDRIRVGFLSAYFRDHTIGRLNLGRVQHLSRKDFHVTVISATQHKDEMALAFQQSADQYVVIPRDVAEARRRIAELGLDILVFADVGMDALTYTLAFSRMAPVQCVTWGHPDTTGSSHMDYFLSSELLETDAADSHYTETLVRLPNLGVYYERPRLTETPRSRAFFDLPEDRHLYVCPQTLFKFHPDFDPVLSGILQADPDGELVLIEGRVANWVNRLIRRWSGTMPQVMGRIRFLPAQPREDFLHLLALADVILDPPHFGGGNTSYEAFAVGSPIVTLPGQFLRSRITQALYRKMDVTGGIVHSAQEYIEQTVRLGTDAEYRQALQNAIQESSHLLFEDRGEVRALGRFLKTAASQHGT